MEPIALKDYSTNIKKFPYKTTREAHFILRIMRFLVR